MMKLLSICFFSFSLIVLLCACNGTPDVVLNSLKRAENCMEAHPDSALKILQAIPNPEEIGGKAQAEYGLLMTEAQEKNYIKLESDSLILLAVNYYSEQEDPYFKGKAYYYYGRYWYGVKEFQKAIEYFLKAKELLIRTKNYKLLGLISSNTGDINRELVSFDDALSNQREALIYYTLAKDSVCIGFAFRDIGRIFIQQKQFDSTYVYYNQALQVMHGKRVLEASVYHDLSVVARKEGKYDEAESYILKSIEKEGMIGAYAQSLSLGKLYIETKRYDEAEKYLKLSIGGNTLNSASAYYNLHQLELIRENYKQAIEYKAVYDSLASIIQDDIFYRNLGDLQKKYKNEQLKNENLEMKNNAASIILLGVILFSVLLVIVAYYYFQYRNNKRIIKEINSQIRTNEAEISGYKNELLKYSESENERQSESELRGKVSLLQTQNKELVDKLHTLHQSKPAKQDSETNALIIAFHTLISLKSGTLTKKDLSEKEIDLQIKLSNFLYDNYTDRLLAEFPDLTKHDLEICCLLKAKCSNEQISRVFNATPSSVSKAKSRLKKRLNIASGGNLEFFLEKY